MTKPFVLIALIALMAIAASATPARSAEQAETNNASVWLEGPGQAARGATIAFDIRTDASGLYGLQIDISFDPSMLQGVGTQLTPGNCPAPDFVVTNAIDNSSGTISYAVSALAPTPPCDGGVVASLQFQVSPAAAGGSTALQFANVILADVNGTEIPATPIDLSLEITEEEAIVANFSGTPTTGPAPLTVSFTNLSTGAYDSCNWSFGDGGSSTTCLNQNHTYLATGRFTVSLTVSGAAGSDNETKVDYIVIVEQFDVYTPVVLANYP